MTIRLLQHTAELIGKQPRDLTINIFNLHLFVNDKYMFNKKEKLINENFEGGIK